MCHVAFAAPRRMWFLLLLFSICSLSIVSCSSPVSTTSTPEQTSVSVQFSWIHEYSSVAFYAAEQNKRFANQNIDIELKAGGYVADGYISPIDEVLNGTVDFGITSASDILLARAAGKPVVSIATIFQRSPFAIISLEKSGIKQPKQLIDKRITSNDATSDQLLKSFLMLQNMNAEDISIVPRTSYGIEQLVNDEVDAMTAWVINEGVLLEEANADYNVMLLSDYGVESYELTIFTTEKTIAERPDLVRRFLTATFQGMQDAINDPDKAVDFIMLYNDQLDRDGQRRRLHATLPLLNPPGTQLGHMDPEVWRFTHQIVSQLEPSVLTLNPEQAYTNSFHDQSIAK